MQFLIIAVAVGTGVGVGVGDGVGEGEGVTSSCGATDTAARLSTYPVWVPSLPVTVNAVDPPSDTLPLIAPLARTPPDTV